MHCADICLSATHNESARKLVMTQFEPCQYRHKSRYASVLQNRCFYTYIWLAYLVRFFERLLRQTTPKLLPLFECLPLLLLLMSLRYSVRPNILSSGRGFDDQFDISQYGFHDLTGAMFISRTGPRKFDRDMYESHTSGSLAWTFDASRNSSLFGASTTNQPAALQLYCLIRY